MMSITIAPRRFTGYKYLLRLTQITISHFFFISHLGFTSLALHLQSMKDKRGTKRAHSPSKEGSSSSSGAKNPPPAPSGLSPPLKSPQEVSSHCPAHRCGGSSRKALVADLSSSFDEGDLIADVSRDEEFVRKLFGDLNRDFLGPSTDDKIIILSDFDEEEEEVHEEKSADVTVVPSSIARSPAPTASSMTPMAPTRVIPLIG
jgi:hypothetical protein